MKNFVRTLDLGLNSVRSGVTLGGLAFLLSSALFAHSVHADNDPVTIGSLMDAPLVVQFDNTVQISGSAPQQGNWTGWLDGFSYGQYYSETPGAPSSIPKGTKAVVSFAGRMKNQLIGSLGTTSAYNYYQIDIQGCTPKTSPQCSFGVVVKGDGSDSDYLPSASTNGLQLNKNIHSLSNRDDASCALAAVGDGLAHLGGLVEWAVSPQLQRYTNGLASNYFYGQNSSCKQADQRLADAQAKAPVPVSAPNSAGASTPSAGLPQ